MVVLVLVAAFVGLTQLYTDVLWYDQLGYLSVFVTENVTKTVPVTREEVRLEREPVTDRNVGDALSGPDISEEEHEVVLTEERPVVAKETVPVERVRLDKETVTDTESVTESTRKEEIELDTGSDTRRDTPGL